MTYEDLYVAKWYIESELEKDKNCNEVKILTECVEKQIPKKPDCEEVVMQGLDLYGRASEVPDKIYTCPVCDSFIGFVESDSENFRYCPDCGQAIDWNEVE